MNKKDINNIFSSSEQDLLDVINASYLSIMLNGLRAKGGLKGF